MPVAEDVSVLRHNVAVKRSSVKYMIAAEIFIKSELPGEMFVEKTKMAGSRFFEILKKNEGSVKNETEVA